MDANTQKTGSKTKKASKELSPLEQQEAVVRAVVNTSLAAFGANQQLGKSPTAEEYSQASQLHMQAAQLAQQAGLANLTKVHMQFADKYEKYAAPMLQRQELLQRVQAMIQNQQNAQQQKHSDRRGRIEYSKPEMAPTDGAPLPNGRD